MTATVAYLLAQIAATREADHDQREKRIAGWRK